MDSLNHIADVSADKGNTYYVFDRDETAKISNVAVLALNSRSLTSEMLWSPGE